MPRMMPLEDDSYKPEFQRNDPRTSPISATPRFTRDGWEFFWSGWQRAVTRDSYLAFWVAYNTTDHRSAVCPAGGKAYEYNEGEIVEFQGMGIHGSMVAQFADYEVTALANSLRESACLNLQEYISSGRRLTAAQVAAPPTPIRIDKKTCDAIARSLDEAARKISDKVTDTYLGIQRDPAFDASAPFGVYCLACRTSMREDEAKCWRCGWVRAAWIGR